MQLVILGMHRSGTSGVTRLLNLAGAWFGPDGIATEANEENPRGFWERRDVREVCDGLLHGGGFDWWKLSGFDADALPDDVRLRWLDRWQEIVDGELDLHRPWVVKEPRLCVLFPVLRPALAAPVCIHVTREPLEVAQSVHRRNGFSVQGALALWELYTRRAFEASAGLPRVLVRYEDLMADPVAATARLVDDLTALGTTGLHRVADDDVHAFISPDLHRQHQDPARRHGRLNQDQVELAAAIDDGTILGDEPIAPLSAAAVDELVELELTQERLVQLAQLEVLERRLAQALARRAEDRRDLGDLAEESLLQVDSQLEALDRSTIGRLGRGAVAARQLTSRGVARTGEGPLDRPRALIAHRRRLLEDRLARPDPDEG